MTLQHPINIQITLRSQVFIEKIFVFEQKIVLFHHLRLELLKLYSLNLIFKEVNKDLIHNFLDMRHFLECIQCQEHPNLLLSCEYSFRD